MKNKLKLISVLLFIVFAFNANAAYYSLHQRHGGLYNQYKPEQYVEQDEFEVIIRMRWRLQDSDIPEDIKIFIPPGTTRIISGVTKQYEGYEMGYAERYKQIPACVYCNGSFNSVQWDDFNKNFSHYELSYMKDNDVYSDNIGGTSYLVWNLGFDTPLSVADSGWYYIHKFGEGRIQYIELLLRVDTAIYFAWRNDPDTCWNEDGDPCDTVDNQEPPTEICNSRHLDKCTKADSCVSAGGYFYDNDNDGVKTCNESKPCNTVDFCNSNNNYGASECNMSGFYYYDINGDGTSECNSQPQNQCDQHHPEFCTTESACDTQSCGDGSSGGCTVFQQIIGACNNSNVCSAEQIHFVSYYKGQKIEACIPKNLKYLPQFDNNSEFDALKNLNNNEALIKRFAFPLYMGDDLIKDGQINNGDNLNLKARLYPLSEAYDLYLALVYHRGKNTIALFFKNGADGWTAQADPIPFASNILPSDNYTESNFGTSFDFCGLLNNQPPLTGDFSIWYLAFPASDKYANNMQGLLRRFQEQKHSIQYYILNNNCNFDME